jgi:hypothetical protein
LKPSQEKPVQIYKARNELEAEVIKSKLESAGIPVLFKTHTAFSAFPLTVDGLAEIKIMVPAELAEEARELVKPEEPAGDDANQSDS